MLRNIILQKSWLIFEHDLQNFAEHTLHFSKNGFVLILRFPRVLATFTLLTLSPGAIPHAKSYNYNGRLPKAQDLVGMLLIPTYPLQFQRNCCLLVLQDDFLMSDELMEQRPNLHLDCLLRCLAMDAKRLIPRLEDPPGITVTKITTARV